MNAVSRPNPVPPHRHDPDQNALRPICWPKPPARPSQVHETAEPAPTLPPPAPPACRTFPVYHLERDRAFHPREFAQLQGATPIETCEVIAGIALVTHLSQKWGEAVVDILAPGALILGDAGGLADCSILAATELRLRPLAGGPPDAVSRRMSEELVRQRHRRLILSQATAQERLAFFLLQLATPPFEGGEACHGCLWQGSTIAIPVSRREIGSMLGLTIETLSRCLAKLRQDGVIKMTGTNLITVLNPAALVALGGDGSVAWRHPVCAAPLGGGGDGLN